MVKKIPATEKKTGVRCRTAKKKEYLITEKITPQKESERFTLWEVKATGYEKIVTGDTPVSLYAKIPW